MDVPGIVRERLGDERRMTSVNVGGDDRVYVTPPRTLVYHASGLFSRESIEEYPHDARRFDVSADRREASFAFEYDDGVQGFSVPRERIETILPPVLAGVLRTNGFIGDDETIEESYRFGERTLVITDSQLLTSLGEAVWDRDHESYSYEHITGLRFEDALVIELDGRTKRLDLAGEGRREAYETLEAALLSYHGVASLEDLPQREQNQPTHTDDTAAEWGAPGKTNETRARTGDINDAESTPLSTASTPNSSAPSESPESPIREAPESSESETPTGEPEIVTQEPADATTERAGIGDNTADLAGELDALRESVERQTELLERQQETLDRLVEKLDN